MNKTEFTMTVFNKRRGKLCFILCVAVVEAQKIAVIGGGISGSFFTRYLADYDEECKVESITVFDPTPVTKQPFSSTDLATDEWQGSRVAALKLKDGLIVEIGASIAHKGFHLVVDMLRGDESIAIGAPFSTGQPDENLRSGMGIYDGNGSWALLTSTARGVWKNLLLVGRYNIELFTISRVCQQAQNSFANLPNLLASDHPDTFYESPDDIWKALGLLNAVHSSFDSLLDVLGLKHELPWWRKFLPYQGLLRLELLSAINLVNYNQDNSQVNGVVGLGSFAAASGGLFSIVGGNFRIIQSALDKATRTRTMRCGDAKQTVRLEEKRVTTVIWSDDKRFTLYSGDELLGDNFDIVVLAAPLQHSQISFLVQSHMDAGVLQEMPLAGMVDAHGRPPEDGHDVLPPKLPESTRRPYTRVVTTVVSNATLNADFFSLPESSLPRSITTTVRGKAALHNITAITQISSVTGVFKLFSDDKLDQDALSSLFGPDYEIEYEKVWCATPDYQGEGVSTNFLLFNGAIGFEGETSSGALYYPLAMEQSSLACMELSAVGARAVAKLVARRIGLIKPQGVVMHDEL
jgi:hypothetical protein